VFREYLFSGGPAIDRRIDAGVSGLIDCNVVRRESPSHSAVSAHILPTAGALIVSLILTTCRLERCCQYFVQG
jgi:hypothetical protein